MILYESIMKAVTRTIIKMKNINSPNFMNTKLGIEDNFLWNNVPF